MNQPMISIGIELLLVTFTPVLPRDFQNWDSGQSYIYSIHLIVHYTNGAFYMFVAKNESGMLLVSYFTFVVVSLSLL